MRDLRERGMRVKLAGCYMTARPGTIIPTQPLRGSTMRVFAFVALLAVATGGSHPMLAKDEKDDKEKSAKLAEEAAREYQNGKNKEANELATKAAKLDPKNHAAHFVLGSAHLQLRQNEEAVKAFTETIKIDPKAAVAIDRRGDAYLKLGKFKEAIEDFDRFLELR